MTIFDYILQVGSAVEQSLAGQCTGPGSPKCAIATGANTEICDNCGACLSVAIGRHDWQQGCCDCEAEAAAQIDAAR
jgi:hypothetical protein